MKRFTFIYAVSISLCVIAYWLLSLISGNFDEGSISISFHIFSEFIMAAVTLAGGILILMGKKAGGPLTIAGMSMLIYSVLNAAGYFGQKEDHILMAVFIFLLIPSGIVLIWHIRNLLSSKE